MLIAKPNTKCSQECPNLAVLIVGERERLLLALESAVFRCDVRPSVQVHAIYCLLVDNLEANLELL